MSERDGYQPGVPCWVETWPPDPEAAVGFYSQLFDWQTEDTMRRLEGLRRADPGQRRPPNRRSRIPGACRPGGGHARWRTRRRTCTFIVVF